MLSLACPLLTVHYFNPPLSEKNPTSHQPDILTSLLNLSDTWPKRDNLLRLKHKAQLNHLTEALFQL